MTKRNNAPIAVSSNPVSLQSVVGMSAAQILCCSAVIVTLSMGIRHGFGLWLLPMTQAMDWSRQDFSFAMAVQNLAWGFLGVFMGMVADRFGAFKVLAGCAVIYSVGLVGMAHATTPLMLALTAGLTIGLAQAGTTYGVVYGVIGRQIPPEKRSWAMGVVAAAGSFGQFLMLPVEGGLIESAGWQDALLILAAMALLIVPLALGLREPGFAAKTSNVKTSLAASGPGQTIAQAMREAFAYPSFLLLMSSYFVCGFQVIFIGVHMPSYLKDEGFSTQVGTHALALIGLFNVFGSYIAGSLGQRIARRKILAFIYFARTVAITIFLLVPLSPMSVYIFSATMGLLWLSTVPPTNATVAQIFGVRHLSMLSGVVFFSHQIGSFLGVWLGGYLYDTTGSYDAVWYIAIALGVFAALMSLPVKENPIARASGTHATG